MPFFFMVVGLAFLIVGGIGLFHANVTFAGNSDLRLYANLTFGMFTFLGAVVLFFLAFFNRELD